MTCREFTDSLGEYVAEEISVDRRATFAAHLAECADCAVYLKSYADAIALARNALDGRGDFGEQMPEDLVRAILAARAKSRIS